MNHQPQRHNCACLVPTGLSDEDVGAVYRLVRYSADRPSVAVHEVSLPSVYEVVFCILQDEITLFYDPDSIPTVITSSYESNLVFSDVFFGQYQQFYTW
jgi:hypothetical protein